MHNIENLIQTNYIQTVKTVSNNNIFQMEVNSQSGQTTKAKNIKWHCTFMPCSLNEDRHWALV